MCGPGGLTCSAVCKENLRSGPGRDPDLRRPRRRRPPRRPRPHGRAALDQSFATGVGFDVEYRIIIPDGSVRWVHQRAQIVRGADGTSLADVRASSLDVTARKAGEKPAVWHWSSSAIGSATSTTRPTSPLRLPRSWAERLDVSRAGYGTIDLAAETITIERDWNAHQASGASRVSCSSATMDPTSKT